MQLLKTRPIPKILIFWHFPLQFCFNSYPMSPITEKIQMDNRPGPNCLPNLCRNHTRATKTTEIDDEQHDVQKILDHRRISKKYNKQYLCRFSDNSKEWLWENDIVRIMFINAKNKTINLRIGKKECAYLKEIGENVMAA